MPICRKSKQKSFISEDEARELVKSEIEPWETARTGKERDQAVLRGVRLLKHKDEMVGFETFRRLLEIKYRK